MDFKHKISSINNNINRIYKYISKTNKLYDNIDYDINNLKLLIVNLDFLINKQNIISYNKKNKLYSLELSHIGKKLDMLEKQISKITKKSQSLNIDIITIFNCIYMPLSLLFCYFSMNFKSMGIYPKGIGIYSLKYPQTGILLFSIILIVLTIYFLRSKKIHSYIKHFINN